MFKLSTINILAAALFFSSFDATDQIRLPTHEVKYLADGLNIEGGIPYNSLKEGQLWANLCVVLDRPFEDGLDLAEITENNSYPLKESSIPTYNEAMVHYAFLTTVHYYITHAQEISKKNRNRSARMVVQIHRNSSGKNHLNMLEELMKEAFKGLSPIKLGSAGMADNTLFSYYYPESDLLVEYRFGYSPLTLDNYEGQDIILSLSLASGFKPEWESGTLMIPEKFIPFNLQTMTIEQSNAYQVSNHFIKILPEVLEGQNFAVLQSVNTFYRSPNIKKLSQRAHMLSAVDFHSATLLQADGIFNPKLLPNSLNLRAHNFE